MTEFAFSGVGLNPHYGTPSNPADEKIPRIPGGSSSGAAVSVATGLCVTGIGSDTGGSNRIPTALSGLTGDKPTASRMENVGCVPLSTTLDTICAMTRSADDCILIDQIIARQAISVRQLSVKHLRLAIPQTLVLDDLDQTVATEFARTVSTLSEAGAVIIDVPMRPLAEYLFFAMFAGAEAFAWHRKLLTRRGNEYDPRVANRILAGGALSAADYLEMHAARNNWIVKMQREFAPFDAIIMPTVPVIAPEIAPLIASDDSFFQMNSLLLRNTMAINILDGCAISIPCHSASALPVGLSINGIGNSDGWILAVARAIESVLSSAE